MRLGPVSPGCAWHRLDEDRRRSIAGGHRRDRRADRGANADPAIARDLTPLKLSEPFLEMEWVRRDEDKTAAWELYIEFITRLHRSVRCSLRRGGIRQEGKRQGAHDDQHGTAVHDERVSLYRNA
jgi:hypothetical protein